MPDGRPGVAVITGASAGVGRATARALAQRGWSLGLLARGTKGLDGAYEDVRRAGVRALKVPTDVADAKAVIGAAEQVEDELGPIDAWINNAMTWVFGPFLEVSLDDVRRVTEVTYSSRWRFQQASLTLLSVETSRLNRIRAAACAEGVTHCGVWIRTL